MNALQIVLHHNCSERTVDVLASGQAEVPRSQCPLFTVSLSADASFGGTRGRRKQTEREQPLAYSAV